MKNGEKRSVSTFERLARMNAAEKMMEALKGDRETRLLLIRDRNQVVFSAVLSSPSLTLGDVEAIARIRNVSPKVLRIIGGKGEWTKYYNIRLELVQNPVTPIETSMKLLGHLSDADLRSIAENPQLLGPLRRRAKKLRRKLE